MQENKLQISQHKIPKDWQEKILSEFFKDDTFINHYAVQFGDGRSLKIRKLKDLKALVLYYNTIYMK